MNVVISSEKIVMINGVVMEYAGERTKRIVILFEYVKNNSLGDTPNISSRIFNNNPNECVEVIEKFKDHIQLILDDE